MAINLDPPISLPSRLYNWYFYPMPLLLALALVIMPWFGCKSQRYSYLPQTAEPQPDTAYGLHPTPDSTFLTRVYIPRDLADCQAEMDRMLPPAMKEEISRDSGRGLYPHRGWLDRWIKDKWGLWSVSRLRGYFKTQGLKHPDDMAGLILDSYWCRRQGKNPFLPCLVSQYQERRRRIDSLSRWGQDIQEPLPLPAVGDCCE